MMKLLGKLRNSKRGFSLVELIVVIAIMAVMVAVLAPSLLQYVERSRAQKDDSAMGEVANAIQVCVTSCGIVDTISNGKIKVATQGLTLVNEEYTAATNVSVVSC